MPTIKIYHQDGSVAGTMELDESVFGVEYNEPLIHQVVVAQMANARQGTKSTLTRTEVRGGGKKPWRQKGTGNARQGSIRAPQWKGGGVVFAPKPRSFRKKVNKLAKMNAFTSALSAKLADGCVGQARDRAKDQAYGGRFGRAQAYEPRAVGSAGGQRQRASRLAQHSQCAHGGERKPQCVRRGRKLRDAHHRRRAQSDRAKIYG